MTLRMIGLVQTGLMTGLVLGLVACGNGGLPSDRIAQSIQDDVIKQGGTSLKSVTCPKSIKPEAGGTFECIGEIESGYTFTIAVKQTDANGNVTWDVPNAKGLINVAKLQTLMQESLQSELGTRPLVECGGAYKPTKPGQSFDCKLDYKKADKKDDKKADQQKNDPASAKPDAADKSAADQSTDAKSAAEKLATDQPTAAKPASKASNKSEKIVVTVDPQGNISWQRVLPGSAVKVATTAAANQPGAAIANQPGTVPPPAADAPAAPAPPAQATGEDFLNKGGGQALED